MSDSKNTSKKIQRDVLPIPDQPYAGFVAYDAKAAFGAQDKNLALA